MLRFRQVMLQISVDGDVLKSRPTILYKNQMEATAAPLSVILEGTQCRGRRIGLLLLTVFTFT